MRDSRREVITFWFEETKPQQWFQKSEEFDQQIKDRFAVVYKMACEGLCDHWKQDAEGALALCLVLDQFPRNMFRNDAKAFATDAKALSVARLSLKEGLDQLLPVIKRRFLYLPFEHSEAIEDQEKSVALFEKIKKDDPLGYDYALKHKDVIERFGRFPHRNAVLGRDNTPEEEEYLAQPGSGF